MKFIILLAMIFLCGSTAEAQWKKQVVDTKASLRGLSVVDEKIVWASGTGGTFLRTVDGGKNWRRLATDRMPPAQPGEAAFAASGTCIITTGENDVWMVTGGKVARVFHSKNRGSGWIISPTQLTNKTEGSGIFSIDFNDEMKGVIVGGDYQKPNETGRNLAFSNDGGESWLDVPGLYGYRSGAAFIDNKTLIAVGSSGSDISIDGGKTWQNLDKENYNSVQAKGGSAVWAVGANGLIAKKILSPLDLMKIRPF